MRARPLTHVHFLHTRLTEKIALLEFTVLAIHGEGGVREREEGGGRYDSR